MAVARLNIRAFEFFDESSDDKATRLIELFEAATSFIEQMTAEDHAIDFALYCPHIFLSAMSLANATLLRIAKCEMSRHVDVKRGERLYFATLQLLRKRSLHYSDLDASTAKLFTQIWQSKRVFVSHDGTQSALRVRLKTRGVMGVVYDIYWHWVHEFSGQKDTYSAKTDAPFIPHTATMAPPAGLDGSSQIVLGYQVPRGDTPSDLSSSSDAMLYSFPPAAVFTQNWEWPPAVYGSGNAIYDFDNLQQP